MKRRNFLKSGAVAGLTPLFVNGYALNKMSASLIPATTCDIDDRVLVIIYLGGANDIINTAVPLNHYTAYQNERPDIHLPQGSLLPLDSTQPANKQLGLHPKLAGLKGLYDNGKLSVVQRVSYPAPNRSHFTSEDNMLKGIDGNIGNANVEDGWIGRFLTGRYPTYNGLPFGTEVDPLGIILGDTPSTGFHTVEAHEMEINLSGQDPAGFYSVISSLSGEPISNFPNSEHGELLTYLAQVEETTQVYSERISTVFDSGSNDPSAGYPNSSLGNQLKTVARFISGGSRTKVYMARKGGWDNHVNEVEVGNTTEGTHANLLEDLGNSIAAFQKDIELLNISQNIITVVFSEFGRKIIQNGSNGTDHGTMSSMFIVGDSVNAGVYGDNIDITNKDSQGAPDPSQLQNDYRTVFANIMQDWMGASDSAVTSTFSNTPSTVVLTNLGLINTAEKVDPTCYFEPTLPVNMDLSVKLFLEGFIDQGTGMMRTNLLDNSLLPYAQPFGETRYSYYGQESVSTFPANTVDWILLEIWNQSNLVIGRKAVLLRNDGRLMDLTGSLLIPIEDLYPEPVRFAFLHRSHIGVLASQVVSTVEGANPFLDITTGPTTVSGTMQLNNVGGQYAMIAGDADQNGLINSADYSYWKRANASSTPGYGNGDFNADGIADGTDYDLWKGNRSKIGNPILHDILKR